MKKNSRLAIFPVFLPHAGCPHQCLFCDQGAITGQAAAPIGPDLVHRAMEPFLKSGTRGARPRAMAFYGGNFLGLPVSQIRELLSAAQTYVDRGLIREIRFSTRPDTVTGETLGLCEEFSVGTMELGAQSMDDQVLRTSRRGHQAQDTRRAANNIKDRGFGLGLQMMVGLPGQDRASVLATAAQLANLAPDFVRIYPTLVIKGSPLAQWWRQGKFQPLDLDRAVDQAAGAWEIFDKAGISVARVGLLDTEALKGSILAGPVHPALGQLVQSRVWLWKASALLEKNQATGRQLVLRTPPGKISVMQGHQKQNLAILTKRYGFASITVREDPALAPCDLAWEHPVSSEP